MDAAKKYKVLVVDDSDFSRNSISRMLTDERFNIIGEASDAKEAINTLNDRTPDIAIVDVVMPGMSGFELTRQMTDRVKDMHIIMISSLAQENVILEAISSGATDFLQKPFTQETLINSLEKIISNIEEA